MPTLGDFEARGLDGKPVKLSRYAGQVVLAVNTASRCGFTPQYAGLQALHERYRDQGLVVLGFPCNQFGAQEPGDAAEIGSFCERNFGVDFPLFAKVDVNGDQAHPLWQWLTAQAPGLLGSQAVKWNFTKFLIARDGRTVTRHAPQVEPAALAAEIETLLAQPGAQ